MAIVRNNSFRDPRLEGEVGDGEPSPTVSGDDCSFFSLSEGNDDVQTASTPLEIETSCSDMSEVESGMESDEYDYSELGEAGSEFCQVGKQSCMIPYELYDLPDLKDVLSLDTWNNCLTEEERFALTEFLPDIDHFSFMQTLKELFSGENFHFMSPLTELFNSLKGGLCEPRVVLYRQGLNFLQRREHYHCIRKYQNNLVGNIFKVWGLWKNLGRYGIEEKLQLLNMSRDQSNLSYIDDDHVRSEIDFKVKKSHDLYWRKKPKVENLSACLPKYSFDTFSRGRDSHTMSAKFEKGMSKETLTLASSKASQKKKHTGSSGRIYPSALQNLCNKKQTSTVNAEPARDPQPSRYEYIAKERVKDRIQYCNNMDVDENTYERVRQLGPKLKYGKKYSVERHDLEAQLGFSGRETSSYRGNHVTGDKKSVDQVVAVTSYDLRAAKKARKLQRDWDDSRNEDWDEYLADNLHVRHGKKTKNKEWETKEGVKLKSQKAVPRQKADLPLSSDDYILKNVPDNIRRRLCVNGNMDMEYHRDQSLYTQNDEMDTDSSDHHEQEVGLTPSRKMEYTSSVLENTQHTSIGSPYNSKKPEKRVDPSQNIIGGRLSRTQEKELHTTKAKKSSKTGLSSYQHDHTTKSPSRLGNSAEDQKWSSKMTKRDLLHGNSGKGHVLPSYKMYSTDKRNEGPDCDYSSHKLNHEHESAGGFVVKEDTDEDNEIVNNLVELCTSSNKNQVTGLIQDVLPEQPDSNGHVALPFSRYKSVSKKRKAKAENKDLDGQHELEYIQVTPDKPTEESNILKKKGKRKVDSVLGSLSLSDHDTVAPETEIRDAEPEARAARKPFTLITPTVHTGFSFSIVHLLSAVRKAMVTVSAEDVSDIANQSREGVNAHHTIENLDSSVPGGLNKMPSLTVQEIINRVRSNPGDPCILETQEPLHELIRGVLKIFSSKIAPLGAKGWKVLVVYEKSTKSWSWIGPISPCSADLVEEETSAEAWNIPHKMLVKLVDAFANWLKSGQEILKEIGSLPPPPVVVLPNLDEKERFRDLRAQKSLITITPSADEVKAYFRKEEFLRYQVPDRAFSYTAADGKKSIVAPLRRGGGKPTSKARDHFMLKPDRPPHVTILCLVRDAACRLPGSIGTRADVCALIRDSQYIMEDVSDSQVNQVVSGALDRLHYERDPCVQYDNERKLWVYLHRDREEEDFEDDGTSSTKKWKKPKKDAVDNFDTAATETYNNANESQLANSSGGFDFVSDPNMDGSYTNAGEKPELCDLRPNMENSGSFPDSLEGTAQGHPMGWEVNLNALQSLEKRMVCQENSTNDNFDDDNFCRERPLGHLLNTNLL